MTTQNAPEQTASCTNCTYCHKPGHNIEKCDVLACVKCNFCHELGHSIKHCGKLRQKKTETQHDENDPKAESKVMPKTESNVMSKAVSKVMPKAESKVMPKAESKIRIAPSLTVPDGYFCFGTPLFFEEMGRKGSEQKSSECTEQKSSEGPIRTWANILVRNMKESELAEIDAHDKVAKERELKKKQEKADAWAKRRAYQQQRQQQRQEERLEEQKQNLDAILRVVEEIEAKAMAEAEAKVEAKAMAEAKAKAIDELKKWENTPDLGELEYVHDIVLSQSYIMSIR